MEEKKIIQTNASKKKVIISLLWKFLERGGVQGIQFVLQIILARILSPEDYGVLAILMAFIAIANVFVQSGLNTALIQKRDVDEVDFSSVFWLSLFISILLYIFLFFFAPIIAKFYHKDILVPVLRVLAITLFFGALNSVQNAMVSKTMQFKRFFFSSTFGVLGSGIIGIICAKFGFGVWALVIQQLTSSFLISIILWFTVKWRPKFVFSIKKVRCLFSFGWKLLCSTILETLYNQIYNLIVGKTFSDIDLGYFSRGEQFPAAIANNLNGSIQSVMLPTLSSHNDNCEEMKRITRRSIEVSSFVLWPCMIGLCAVAKPLVQVLLTDKWLPCVPYLQLACLSFALYPIHTANLTAINAMGRSDLFLKLEIVKKIIGCIVIIVTLPFGLSVMAIGRVIQGIVATFINAFPNKKILNYSYIEQIKDILPSILLSFVMGIIVYIIGYFPLKPFFILLIQIISGIIIYFMLSKIFKLEVYKYFINTIKELRKKRK